jgi:hypothetical protein
MTKAFYSRSIFFMIVFALSIPCLAAEDASFGDIKNAAKEGIATFFKDSRSINLHRLGFESQTDIDNAELGDGFQIFTILPARLLNESASQELQHLVTPTKQWQFLILAGGKANALLTVDLVGGKWTPVSMGSSGLARELSAFLAAWPAASGYQYRLIRVYQAKSDFIELSRGGRILGIIALTAALTASKGGAMEAFDPRDLRDPKEVLSDLRPVVRQNMQLER